MKTKRAKATDISMRVKRIVWERDKNRCVLCENRNAMPNAHYISRAQGGLGIEENIITLCNTCHFKYDNTIQRPIIKKLLKSYLSSHYDNWDEKKLTYKKWR